MKIDKDRRRGLIGTIIVHIVLLVALLLVALRTPLPLPGEEGVEVNLGYDDQGYGKVQSDVPPPKAEPEPVQKEIIPPTPEPDPEPEVVEEDIITQDIEEAPSLEDDVEEKEPEKEIDEEIKEVDKQPEKEVVEEKPLEEVVDSVFVQEDPVEEVVVEDPKPVVNKRALYTGSTSDGTGTNQGITVGAGDQGKPHGYKESDDYDGKGGSGNGIHADLGGRGSLHLEKPSAKFNEQGKVVVDIWVDQNGVVKKAQVSAKGTTVLDQNLRRIAVDAAYNSKFITDNNAPELQRGKIHYNFILMK